MTSECILWFVKAPQPGKVKTRLAQAIGVYHAQRLYQCFVQDLLQLLTSLPVDCLIFYTPAPAREQIRDWLGAAGTCWPQVGADLGDRMAQAFQQAFHLGYERALILGSDSPDLPPAYLQQALEQLRADQVVIGPAADGGYYTLGFTAKNFLPDVFQGIAWSTPTVYANTCKILAHQQRRIHPLPTWYDLDTLADLEQFAQRHRSQTLTSQTMQYLIQHQQEIFVDLSA